MVKLKLFNNIYKDKKGYYVNRWNPKTEKDYKKYLPKSWKPKVNKIKKTKTKKLKKTKTKTFMNIFNFIKFRK